MPLARYFGNSFALLLLIVLFLTPSDAHRSKREAAAAAEIQSDSPAVEDVMKRNWANKIRFGKRADDDDLEKRWASQLRFGKRYPTDQQVDDDADTVADFFNKRGSWASKVRFG